MIILNSDNTADYLVPYKEVMSEAVENSKIDINEYLKFITGKSNRHNLYGNIGNLYEEEYIALYNSVTNSNIDDITMADKFISKSTILGPNLRIFIMTDGVRLENILGYEDVTFYGNGRTIHSLFVEGDRLNSDVTNIYIMHEISRVNIISKLREIGINGQNIADLIKGFSDGNLVPTLNSSINAKMFVINYMIDVLVPIFVNIDVNDKDLSILKKILVPGFVLGDQFYSVLFDIVKHYNPNIHGYDFNLKKKYNLYAMLCRNDSYIDPALKNIQKSLSNKEDMFDPEDDEEDDDEDDDFNFNDINMD